MNARHTRPLVQGPASLSGNAAPDSGALAFGSVTGTTAATANTVVTATDDRAILEVMNPTDADLVLAVNNVSTNLVVRAGTSKIYDLGPAQRRINGGDIVGVYRRSGAPTVSEVIIQLIQLI